MLQLGLLAYPVLQAADVLLYKSVAPQLCDTPMLTSLASERPTYQ